VIWSLNRATVGQITELCSRGVIYGLNSHVLLKFGWKTWYWDLESNQSFWACRKPLIEVKQVQCHEKWIQIKKKWAFVQTGLCQYRLLIVVESMCLHSNCNVYNIWVEKWRIWFNLTESWLIRLKRIGTGKKFDTGMSYNIWTKAKKNKKRVCHLWLWLLNETK
jgi:hypothetical protein